MLFLPARLRSLWLGCALAIPLTAFAQPTTTMSATTRRAVIDSVQRVVRALYVDADTGKLIAAALAARADAHAYDDITDPTAFAAVVTRDLHSVNGDVHTRLQYMPPVGARASTGPADEAALVTNAQRGNFAMRRVEILDGNVGYMEVTAFAEVRGYQEVFADALRFLARTDAIIIDLRRNSGGFGGAFTFLFSHFLPEREPTFDASNRAGERRRDYTLAKVPGPRRTDVPLYILTSGMTASAAEGFTFVLKNRGRATTVGTRTMGAGRVGASTPVGFGFEVYYSTIRMVDARTGREFERVGIAPDIVSAPEAALDVAYAAALRGIIAGNRDAAYLRTLNRLLAVADARVAKRPSQSGSLARFAGEYEGRGLSVVNGQLAFARREGALPEPLVELGRNRFGFASTVIELEEKDGQTFLIIEQLDGTQLRLARKPASTR